MIKVTSNCQEDYLKVYFNEVLHLSIYIGNLVGVQCWVESSSWYCIEYVFKGKANVRSQYGSEELWKAVIKEIDQYV